MNILHDIEPERVKPERFTVVIEISKGSKNKYELDKTTGMLKLDRVLSTSTQYPANYGFIPRTYAGDHDPLDVMVLCSESIYPMTLVECKPIGVLTMDDSGEVDEKIIAVSLHDPYYNSYQDVSELPAHLFEELKHFYTVYKMLENKETIVHEVLDRLEAMKVIEKSMRAYEMKEYNRR
ncbi:inorganic diphosphatase [Clostridia bacterium]|nr:inorganic diphosphatase [Clostridia bacterium]